MSNIIKNNSNNNAGNITKQVGDLIEKGEKNPKGTMAVLAAAAIAVAGYTIKTIGEMTKGGK